MTGARDTHMRTVLGGLTQLAQRLTTLRGRPPRVAGPPATAGDPIVANGQVVARLAVEGGSAEARQAALDCLAAEADRSQTVSDLTRQLLRSWQESTFYYTMSRRLEQLPDPDDAVPALLAQLAATLEAEGASLEATAPVAGRWSHGRECAAAELAGCFLATEDAIAVAIHEERELPDGLDDAAREAIRAALPVALAPILEGGLLTGWVAVSRPSGAPFSSHDTKLLVGGAAMAAAALGRWARTRALTYETAIRRELEVAAEIQANLRPRQALHREDLACWGWCRTASQIGGDFYGWWGGRQAASPAWVYVGDVSGHGVGAALLAANSQAMLRSLCRDDRSAADVAARYNSILCADVEHAMEYITLALVRIDPAAGVIEHAGLGHPPVMVRRAATGAVALLDGEGPPAGIFGGAVHPSSRLAVAAGDMLLLYTDGCVEATDGQGEELGLERLAAWFAAEAGPEPEQVVQALTERLDAFMAGTPAEDDQALLVVRLGP